MWHVAGMPPDTRVKAGSYTAQYLGDSQGIEHFIQDRKVDKTCYLLGNAWLY